MNGNRFYDFKEWDKHRETPTQNQIDQHIDMAKNNICRDFDSASIDPEWWTNEEWTYWMGTRIKELDAELAETKKWYSRACKRIRDLEELEDGRSGY